MRLLHWSRIALLITKVSETSCCRLLISPIPESKVNVDSQHEENMMVQMSMKLIIGGHVGPSRYLEVWKDSPAKPDCVTSATERARPRAISAPSAPRHWEVPHVAPAAACQAPGLEPQTDGKARDGHILPLPFFLFRSFYPICSPKPQYSCSSSSFGLSRGE